MADQTIRPLLDRVRRAISDPGAVLPRHSELRDGQTHHETVASWGARAVLAVLADADSPLTPADLAKMYADNRAAADALIGPRPISDEGVRAIADSLLAGGELITAYQEVDAQRAVQDDRIRNLTVERDALREALALREADTDHLSVRLTLTEGKRADLHAELLATATKLTEAQDRAHRAEAKAARYLQRIEELAAEHRKEKAAADEWKRLHDKAAADRAAAVQYADRAHTLATQYADQAIANGRQAARLRLAWESARRGRRKARAKLERLRADLAEMVAKRESAVRAWAHERDCHDQTTAELKKAETERARLTEQAAEGPHRPTVARLASGEWGVCCIACSNKAGDHVPRCLINPNGWPPLTLIRAVPGSSLLEAKAAAQATAQDGLAGGERDAQG